MEYRVHIQWEKELLFVNAIQLSLSLFFLPEHKVYLALIFLFSYLCYGHARCGDSSHASVAAKNI